MNIKAYQKFALTTLAVAGDKEATIENCVMGLVGETGEIFDLIKKHWFHKKNESFPIEKLIDEGGDVLWYVANLATVLDRQLLGYTCKRDYDDDVLPKGQILVSLGSLIKNVNEVYQFYCGWVESGEVDPDPFVWRTRHYLDRIVEYLQDVFDAIKTYLYETEPTTKHISMLTIENAMEYNMKKLQQRHKDGFTSDYKSDSVQ